MRVSQGETAFAPSGRCASARGQPARPQPKAVDGPPLAGTQVCPPAPLLGLLAFFKCWMGYLLTPRCTRCRPADKRGKLRIPALPTGSAGKQPETAHGEPFCMACQHGLRLENVISGDSGRFSWDSSEGAGSRGWCGPQTAQRSRTRPLDAEPQRTACASGARTKGEARHACSPSLTAASGPRQGRRRHIENSRRQVAPVIFK